MGRPALVATLAFWMILTVCSGTAFPADYLKQAQELERAGNAAEAIAAYQKAIEQDRDDDEAQFGLARLLFSKGDYRGAEKCFRSAIALDYTKYAERVGGIYYREAGVRLAQDDLLRAREFYEKAERCFPNGVWADLMDAGKKHLLNGRIHDAENVFNVAVYLKPDLNREIVNAFRQEGAGDGGTKPGPSYDWRKDYRKKHELPKYTQKYNSKWSGRSMAVPTEKQEAQRTYGPGQFVFDLEAGEETEWIHLDEGLQVDYDFVEYFGTYSVQYRNGLVVHQGSDFPLTARGDFKIHAIEKSRVELRIAEPLY